MYYSCTWLVRPVPKSSQARRKLKNVIRYDYIKVFPWLALISLFWSSLILVMLKLRSFAYSTICGVFMYGHLRSKGRCHATTISQGGESVHSFPANDDVGTCCLHDLCSRKFTISATTIRPCARFDYEDSFLLRAIGEVHWSSSSNPCYAKSTFYRLNCRLPVGPIALSIKRSMEAMDIHSGRGQHVHVTKRCGSVHETDCMLLYYCREFSQATR